MNVMLRSFNDIKNKQQDTKNNAEIFVQNQLDTSNIQNLFCHKTLHFSGIFCAYHQELSTVHSEIGTFHAGYVTAS
jgi:midasin (ATPase involved in ribosome maturation)